MRPPCCDPAEPSPPSRVVLSVASLVAVWWQNTVAFGAPSDRGGQRRELELRSVEPSRSAMCNNDRDVGLWVVGSSPTSPTNRRPTAEVGFLAGLRQVFGGRPS